MNFLFFRKKNLAAIRINGIWVCVEGEKKGYDFYYCINGKTDISLDGSFLLFPARFKPADADRDVMEYNISDLRKRVYR